MQDRAVWKSARDLNNLRKLCSNHVQPMPMRTVTSLLFTTVVSFRRAQWATLRRPLATGMDNLGESNLPVCTHTWWMSEKIKKNCQPLRSLAYLHVCSAVIPDLGRHKNTTSLDRKNDEVPRGSLGFSTCQIRKLVSFGATTSRIIMYLNHTCACPPGMLVSLDTCTLGWPLAAFFQTVGMCSKIAPIS